MCGIAGFLGHCGNAGEVLAGMSDALQHRGPDGAGIWIDPRGTVGLAHRRLAVIDQSSAGGQPMESSCGRYVIVFNGEIYNCRQLRVELEPTRQEPWRGHSDTEILLESIRQWGIQKTLRRSNGMFAVAIWDRQRNRLTLARDRMGEKPLYVAWMKGVLIFASELSALRRCSEWRPRLSTPALSLYARLGYVPDPYSIFENTFKLPPAHYIELSLGMFTSELQADSFLKLATPYWSLADVAEQERTNERSEARLHTLLKESVQLRMVSDVPIGALLSGGIDSSLITAVMQSQSSNPIKTFCIGFREKGFDESLHAQQVAEHLGTDHTSLTITANDTLALIPKVPQIYDEPFADPSQLPMIIVSELARRRVTVALSGDGADELFGGYARYRVFANLWKVLKHIPSKGRAKLVSYVADTTRRLLPKSGTAVFKASRFSHRLQGGDFRNCYFNYMSMAPFSPLMGDQHPEAFPDPWLSIPHGQLDDPYDLMMYFDQAVYLPGDILTKTDRASMALGLELRAPLLDHRIVELSWQLPVAKKIDSQRGKLPLRKLLSEYLPDALIDRPKHGFDVPIGAWLRGPLKEWMLDLLQVQRIRQDGFLNPETVSMMVERHLAGKGDYGYPLWVVLMFQAWLRHNGGRG